MPIRKAVPGRSVSASWLNDLAVTAEQARLARSNLTDGRNDEGGTGTRPADYNPLLIFKVTGAITGGYSFEEVTDPDVDGTYTTADSGLSSTGTGLVLVAASTMVLATNDLVLVRRNPFYAERYEALSTIKTAGGGGGGGVATGGYEAALTGSSPTPIVGTTASPHGLLTITLTAAITKFTYGFNASDLLIAPSSGAYILFRAVLTAGATVYAQPWVMGSYQSDNSGLIQRRSCCFSMVSTLSMGIGDTLKLQAATVGSFSFAQARNSGESPGLETRVWLCPLT